MIQIGAYAVRLYNAHFHLTEASVDRSYRLSTKSVPEGE